MKPHAKLTATFVIATIAFSCGFIAAGQETPPRVFTIPADTLVKTKQRVLANDTTLDPAIKRLLSEASAAMSAGPFSVTTATAKRPSGDPHDYISLSIYCWPDPKNHKGPWIIKDGQPNPDVYTSKYSSKTLWKMIDPVYTLSIAWYFTEDEKYAEQATKVLRTFFLDSDTRMNPNMNYAAIRPGVPGKADGDFYGIVEACNLVKIIDSIGMLANSKAWTDVDQKGMEKWFDSYLDWLLNSQHGKEESKTLNNHSTYYNVQVACYALFVGKKEIVKHIIKDSRELINTQILPDGSQPLELKRTRSLHYSLFNLTAFARLANMGKIVDVDLWNYKGPKGVSIRKAIEFMIPYTVCGSHWPHKQIGDQDALDYTEMYPILRQAAVAYNDSKYNNMTSKASPSDRNNLLYPAQAK